MSRKRKGCNIISKTKGTQYYFEKAREAILVHVTKFVRMEIKVKRANGYFNMILIMYIKACLVR